MTGKANGNRSARHGGSGSGSRNSSGSQGSGRHHGQAGADLGRGGGDAGTSKHTKRWQRRKVPPDSEAATDLWSQPLTAAANSIAAAAEQQQINAQIAAAAEPQETKNTGQSSMAHMARKFAFALGGNQSSSQLNVSSSEQLQSDQKTLIDSADHSATVNTHTEGQSVRFTGVPPASSSPPSNNKTTSKSHTTSSTADISAGNKQAAISSNNNPNSTTAPQQQQPTENPQQLRVRQLARRCLALSQRSDWMAVEQTLKTLERLGVDVGIRDPLAGVVDEVGYSPLMYAVKENRVMMVDKLVEAGCDVNQYNKEGFSILHIAVLYAREDMIKVLFNRRADVHALTGPKKMTCVHLVCTRMAHMAVNILRMFLQATHKDIRLVKDVYFHPGSSTQSGRVLLKTLLTTDSDGNIPLFLAIEAGSMPLCKELLTYQADLQVKVRRVNTQDTVLHMATRRRDLELVRLFSDYNVPVDVQNKDGQTALHIAAADGDDNMVKFFYHLHANANIPDNEDRTPLHIASERGHALVVELLADKFRASVMERTKDGSTLMHIASLYGHPEAVMAFLRKGVPLQMPNKAGERAIHTAAMAGHASVINALISKGESVDSATKDNYTALHLAVKQGNPSVVETLLGHGAQVEIRGGTQKETPLHIAARVDGGERCVEMLLKSGASVKLITHDGQTPLHLASFQGHLKTCQFLLADKADPFSQANAGETSLHLACKGTHFPICKQLRDFVVKSTSSSSDPAAKLKKLMNMRNEEGETALHYTARTIKSNLHYSTEDQDIVKLLCENGGSLDVVTKVKETPFHYVAKYGNKDVLKEMLHHLKEQVPNMQVVLNRQNISGASCLMLAAHNGHYEVAQLLLENNVRVDVFDADGKSALHLAGEKGYVALCTTLLSHKAFVNARSKQGLTALHLAAMNGNNDLIKTLVQKHHASLDANTLAKQTPLHMAAEAGQLEVCRTLIQMKSNANATNDSGQKPIHLAAQENHSEVVKLFLKHFPELVNTADRGGNTCAHIAASKGSVDVIKELMKFNKQMVTSFHNKTSESTPLHMAAEGGHPEVVRVLIDAGASPNEENKYGMTPVHLAARKGESHVLATLREKQVSMRTTSKKNGLSALHVAAYYGEAEIVRELLQHVPATLKSETPSASGTSIIRELGSESGLTPLHMAAYSGQENIVRLLMNSPGVLVEATTNLNSYIPLHLACVGGHTAVAGLLLSRSAEQLQCKDRKGRTSLHISAMNGHLAMVSQLLGQGADISATDKDGWAALHYSAKNGHLEVVKQLIESGASSKAESNNGKIPLCFAVSSEHFDVIEFLLRKEHDTYDLLSDKKFVSDLTMVSRKHNNKPLQDFVLLSPAPVEVAAKLSFILLHLSTKEKEKTRDLSAASHFCEVMATDILSLAAGSKSAGMLLRALDYEQTEFLDVLIQLEQKEVIAHPAVQRYLNEVWIGQMEWSNYWTVAGILLFFFCPPVWMFFSLPLGHKYSHVPVIKFISQVVSHFYFIILLTLTVVTPLWPIWISTDLVPHVPEWLLFLWLSGMVLSELTNPGERTGLGILRIISLVSGCSSIGAHLIGFAFSQEARLDVLYVRNQLLAVSMLFACVQLLDFLTFHHLFGPWTVIIRALMVDLGRFLVIMSIFILGFSLHVAAIYQPVRPKIPSNSTSTGIGFPPNEAPVQNPLQTLEMMFFSIFGLIDTYDYLPPLNTHPAWSQVLIKIVFGTYMIVAVIVLINLLIAMMSDTYQRIQAKSDTEWKFGLAKLIRNTNRTSSAPSPLNLVTKLLVCINALFVFKGRVCNYGALEYIKTEQLPKDDKHLDVSTNLGANFFNRLRRRSIGPGLALPSRSRGSGSTADLIMDISQTQSSSASASTTAKKLESVIDWTKLVAKYLDERNLPDDITTVNKYLANSGHAALMEKDDDDSTNGDGGAESTTPTPNEPV